MSEYLAAHLTIGGPIPRRLVARLCATIGQERLALDWGEPVFQPQSADDLLAACIDLGGVRLLRLYDEQARWGQFEELERLLVRHKIAFDRHNEGKYEISPEWFAFRPGLGGFPLPTNAQEQVVIEAEPLWPLADRLAAARRAVRQGDNSAVLRELTAMGGILKRSLPTRVPPLPDLEIVARRRA